jgi:fructose-1,6-bisphosphatase/inositol monophosphatase family enzyme
VTYGIDVPAEEVLTAWLDERASEGPLSLFTEDTGWRHRGPSDPETFDHGGPRIVVDPVDGTRALFADMRSAWTVVGFAGPGAGQPRQSELLYGLVAELPTSRAAVFRVLASVRGAGCTIETSPLQGAPAAPRTLRADDDPRADGGYFPFFRYTLALLPAIASADAAFRARIAEHEGADTRTCFDDQYLSNAGQLVLLALGTYRMIVDARGTLRERLGVDAVTSKPYDVSGALLCAEGAGCVVTTPEGTPLDYPLDGEFPVSFVGFHNAGTAERLGPHLRAVLLAGDS